MVSTALDTLGGDSISAAWINTVVALGQLPDRAAHHVVTRIASPATEEAVIREAADELSAELGFRSIETVANTIFPERLARSCRDHHELAQRYRGMYPTIRSLSMSNRNGTYFGRLVAYPTATSGEGMDQLSDLIRKLQVEQAAPGPKSARYEIGISAPGLDTEPAGDTPTAFPAMSPTSVIPAATPPAAANPGQDDHDVDDTDHHTDEDIDGPASGTSGGDRPGVAVPVYVPGEDRSAMGFPCLSFCSFQLDHGRLHLLVHYRRQLLIERGYGNYLGLARLLCYVGEQVGATPGQLMIVAGVAKVDAVRYRLTRLAQQCRR